MLNCIRQCCISTANRSHANIGVMATLCIEQKNFFRTLLPPHCGFLCSRFFYLSSSCSKGNNNETSGGTGGKAKEKSKTIRLRTEVGDHDLDRFVNKTKELLDKGFGVSLQIQKRRRDVTKPREVYDKFYAKMKTSEGSGGNNNDNNVGINVKIESSSDQNLRCTFKRKQ